MFIKGPSPLQCNYFICSRSFEILRVCCLDRLLHVRFFSSSLAGCFVLQAMSLCLGHLGTYWGISLWQRRFHSRYPRKVGNRSSLRRELSYPKHARKAIKVGIHWSASWPPRLLDAPSTLSFETWIMLQVNGQQSYPQEDSLLQVEFWICIPFSVLPVPFHTPWPTNLQPSSQTE